MQVSIGTMLLSLATLAMSQSTDTCILNGLFSNADDIGLTCGPGIDLGDLDLLCDTGECFNILLGIYDNCNSPLLRLACEPDNRTPEECVAETIAGNFNDVNTICVSRDRDLNDFETLCADTGECLSILLAIHDNCNSDLLAQVCNNAGNSNSNGGDANGDDNSGDGNGNGGTDGNDVDISNGFPFLDDLPEPTADQQQCLDDLTLSEQDFARECEFQDLENLNTLCNSGSCFNLFSTASQSCNYDGFNVACNGSPTMYAGPVCVLISTVISSLF